MQGGRQRMATPEAEAAAAAADAVALAVARDEAAEEDDDEAAAAAAGEGGLEVVVPIGAQKHDPAWKHCLMVRLAGRDRLKCVYCGKHFLGGGIHRFKEHLARRPGNACCCPDVPADVEALMHRSLDEVAAKKLRKRALAAAMAAVASADPAALPAASSPSPSPSASNGELASPIHVLPLNQAPRAAEEAPPMGTGSGWTGGGATKRRKKALAVRRAPASVPQAQQHPLQPATPAPQTQPPHQTIMALDATATALPLSRHVDPAAGSDRDQVCMAVGRFLYDAGVPLEAVNSVHFQPMVDAISSMGGKPEVFSYHDFRGCVLKKSLDEVSAQLEYYKGSWTRTGCSVLSDEWTTDKGRTLMTFSVYCPEGTMFLKSVDATDIVTSSDALFELLKSVVEEVGEKNVVQVITNNSEIHAAAGKRLGETFPTLFWSPCTFRCIDGMLQDFSKETAVSEIISNAKTITGFLYSSALALSLMKKHLQGKDLLVPAETRAAMNFVTLKNMYSVKEDLQAMISSDEWVHCLLPKIPGGIEVSNIVSNSQFWSSCALVVRATEPLVHLLKLVGSNKRPAMGYVYAGLYKAKAAIKKELVKKSDYMPYWNIIDQRWDRHMQRPLHSAGFFLNPLFFDGIGDNISNEVFSGMLDCVERLVSDVKIQDKIQKELNMYRSEAAGDFRRQMAIRARRTLPPAEWWYMYGGACPNLTRLAVRVLSQTSSAKGCDRTHIPFEQLHDQRMNIFERQRMHHLTFVQCNLRLQYRQQYKAKAFDPISVDYIDIVDDWVVDRSALFSGPAEQPNWMEISQPFNWTSSAGPGDEFESFIEGVDDEMIQGASRGIQADDDDKDDSNDVEKTLPVGEQVGSNLDKPVN
ncbi:uncharacterized protein [Triticum aestivum]|uniref:uncharacterized protein isoform X1 n=2 Tax=Triticum aestivum TaxID=4565 RepID=UPI001D014047|nr:uncharacterized protein LOC123105697 isoform X1 [Triticum aestivum]